MAENGRGSLQPFLSDRGFGADITNKGLQNPQGAGISEKPLGMEVVAKNEQQPDWTDDIFTYLVSCEVRLKFVVRHSLTLGEVLACVRLYRRTAR